MAQYNINKYDYNNNTYLLEDNRLSDADITRLDSVAANAAAVTIIDSTSGTTSTTNLSELVINKLTKAQYDNITTPSSSQLYMITDDTIYATKDYVDNSLANFSTTDNKVTTTLATTTKSYLAGTGTSTTSTGGLNFDTGVYLTTTAGQLNATTYKVNENVTLSYNTTTHSLDIVVL